MESVAADGGAKHLIASTRGPHGLAIDPQNAYWIAINATPPNVETASRTTSDGGAPKVLAAGETDAALTWVDGGLASNHLPASVGCPARR